MVSENEKIRLSKPYYGDVKKLKKMIDEIIESGYLVQGKYVEQFEGMVADYLGVKHAVAVSSGTAALHLAALSIGISPEDEVIVPAYTFPATANVIELIGAKAVLVDVDADTYNICPKKIEEKITEKTKAIMPVHLFGNPVDMDEIMGIANKYGLKVIEDSAGAFGTEYKGRKCGAIGDVGCFSFHPRKLITTGEGGMVVTNNDEIAEKVMVLRNHGISYRQSGIDFVVAGFNYRMNEIEAAMGIVQLEKINEIIKERERVYSEYIKLLKDIPFVVPQLVREGNKAVLQAFVIKLENMSNKEVISKLIESGVEANIGTYALNELSYYKAQEGECPVSSKLYKSCVALPFYNEMSREEIEKVVVELKNILEEKKCN